MEIKQLEYYRAVVECGSISKAAGRLHMSQPPLSYQMKQLEAELGVQLFERGPRQILLTQAGQVFYERAIGILNLSAAAIQETSRISAGRTLHLGITSTASPLILPYISRFSALYPDVRYEIHDGTTFEMQQLLEHHIVDIATMRTPISLSDVCTRHVTTEPMIAADLSFSSAEGITLSSLSKRPLILYRRYRELILQTFHDHALTPDIFCECDDARTALAWAEEGLGTAIFPCSMKPLCTRTATRTIKAPELETEIFLAWKKSRHEAELLKPFLALFDSV